MKKKNRYSWHDSFHTFHLISNEKARITSAIVKEVKTFIPQLKDGIWVDVGCGDCTQISLIADKLPSFSEYILCDPDWANLIRVADDSLVRMVKKTKKISLVPTFFKKDSLFDRQKPFVISAIHSLFDETGHQTLKEIAKLKNRHPAFYVFVAEHKDSFISIARQNLRQSVTDAPKAISDPEIEEFFGNMQVSKTEISKQYIAINISRQNNSLATWVAPFIMGEPEIQYKMRSETEKTKIERSIHSTILLFNDPNKLPIPDNLWVIKPKQC